MKHIDDAKILSLHKQKKPANEIAIRFQVHPHTIHRRLKRMGIRSRNALEKGHLGEFAEIMLEHWKYKKQRSNSMSNPKIDEWVELALNNGALGGKLIGAGGGLCRGHEEPSSPR